MRMIADLWPKIDSDLPFTTIKTILLERFSPRTTDCLESLSAAQRGDDTVTEYLVRLQTLLTSHYSNDSDIARALIRRKLLDSVDAETCIALYPYEQEPLESLAKHADRILARKKLITATSPIADPHVSQNPTNQAIINQMLESRLDKLDRTLSSCYHSPRQPADNRRLESGHVFSRAPPPKSFAPPSLNLCSYHHRFGHRAFKCEGPPCSMYTQHQAKKRPVDLHEIEAWRSQTAPSRPLLFIHDSCHDIDFLIDTGASYSIIPSHVIDNSKSFNTGTYHVSTIGGGTLEIDGQLKTQINLGFSQVFEYNFVIAALPYGIIGADFLRYFNLCVDLNARTLFKSHDEEKFVPPIDEGVATEFTIESSQTSNIEHVSGKDNIADALSRPFEPPLINLLTPVNKPLDFLELAIAQRSDSECEELRHDNHSALILKDIPLAEHGINVLCDISTRKIRTIIPRALRFSVFKHLHCLSHPGIRGSVALLTQSVVWVGIKKDVAQWARECLKCSRSKIQRHNKAPLNEINPPPSERFTHVYIDITGPLPPSNGYSYLLMIIDRYSRFIQAVPLRGITAEECSSAFVHGWVSLFGSPEHIYCDRGAQFTSALWRDLAQFLGAQLHHSTAYHPQAQEYGRTC